MITEHLKEPILCAVSGGADSMYMLARLKSEGFAVVAAHYNHCLRGAESDRDEAFVRGYCAANGVPFAAERGNVRDYAVKEGMSLETAARELRYAFLQRAAESFGAACIATAHTADDNAETMLFHLARGTGLRGLGGIPPVRGNIVRPILDCTRSEIVHWLTEHRVAYVEDSTNASDDYARNRIRHAVCPVLTEINKGFLENTVRTAQLLREDEAFLQSLADAHIADHGADATALNELPQPIAVRVVRKLTRDDLSRVHLDAILRVAREGGTANVPGLRVSRRSGRLCIGAESEKLREQSVATGSTTLEAAGLVLRAQKERGHAKNCAPWRTFFFPDEVICGTMSVGPRREGDRIRPIGRGCSKSLKQLFQEAGVEPWQRDAWPVLRDDQGVLAVYGIAADERTAGSGNDKYGWKLAFQPITEE